MTQSGITPPPVLPEPVPVPQKTLRRLFLTLFLRGRGARGLNQQGAPKTVGEKLALTLFFYLLFGCMALFFAGQPLFALAVYLHGMTFVFLGMFVASSAGEVLFNKEEADILLHRPVSPQLLLRVKIRVIVEISLWLALAFNCAGLFIGMSKHWPFPLIHICSTVLESLFCTGCVVLLYQLCLRWFGRERLDNLMTMAQVILSITVVLGGQIVPQMVLRVDRVLDVNQLPWWINLLPPAWFAGLDDAFAGSAGVNSWVLALLAVLVTAVVLWLALAKLARDYEIGLQSLGETAARPASSAARRRWLDWMITVPPLSWWLRDPVARASFLLTAAYLLRDRDVKLRVYPGVAPILILPFVFLLQNRSGSVDFTIPFSGIYLGLVPLLGLQILQYSQQFQAAEIFRIAPLAGPAPLCHGARRAVLCFLTLPMLLLVGLLVWLLRSDPSQMALFLPGLIALPVFALVANLRGQGVPLSLPPDVAKSASRGLRMIVIMVIAMALSGLTTFARSQGWFWWMLLGESLLAAIIYITLRLALNRTPWPANE